MPDQLTCNQDRVRVAARRVGDKLEAERQARIASRGAGKPDHAAPKPYQDTPVADQVPGCELYDELMGVCGDRPAKRYLPGRRCRPHAPGATDLACEHGTSWLDSCGKCDGTAPKVPPLPSRPRVQREYGGASHDPLGRTITTDDSGKRFADRLPRRPCPTCARPRAKGHKGDCAI